MSSLNSDPDLKAHHTAAYKECHMEQEACTTDTWPAIITHHIDVLHYKGAPIKGILTGRIVENRTRLFKKQTHKYGLKTFYINVLAV